jgi:hypothetical protein
MKLSHMTQTVLSNLQNPIKTRVFILNRFLLVTLNDIYKITNQVLKTKNEFVLKQVMKRLSNR